VWLQVGLLYQPLLIGMMLDEFEAWRSDECQEKIKLIGEKPATESLYRPQTLHGLS